MNSSINFAVITVSDRCSVGLATDDSGKLLQDLMCKTFHPSCSVFYKIIPDDLEIIKNTLKNICDTTEVNVIFTTGGTGFSSRDNTPEATKAVIEKEAQQLTLAMSLESFKITKFAALSRAICGIRKKTLIINLPGSKKAVTECFHAICDVIPHAVQLIINDLENIDKQHKLVQNNVTESSSTGKQKESHHVCPHKTATTNDPYNDRNSIYPMIDVHLAVKMIMNVIPHEKYLQNEKKLANMNLPPFRASIKDGYAVKCAGGKGVKKVIGSINAGDKIMVDDFLLNECFKINTGAPVPDNADCVIQIEDTKLLSKGDDDQEKEIEILIDPIADLDIRPIGSDLKADDLLFGHESHEFNPGNVASASIFSSIGELPHTPKIDLIIGIISTGDELIAPGNPIKPGQIYDSNTTILQELLKQFGYTNVKCFIAKDSRESLKSIIESKLNDANVIICSGGVSMGDKDFVKSILTELQFKIHFGRVNMKPGKPMTFASNSTTNDKYFFGLPGNPVSTYVTFHLFVLPALRKLNCYSDAKCCLPIIKVRLENHSILLDSRPEYARAKILSKNGVLYASVLGNQISSRLQSIIGADVLLHLPPQSADRKLIMSETILDASVLKFDFISEYQSICEQPRG